MERRRLEASKRRTTRSSPAESESPRFFGDRLRLARRFHGLTLTGLGERAAADPSLLSRIERGKEEPSALLFDALVETLDFDHGFFAAPLIDPFAPEECHFRHLQKMPKRLKEMVSAQGTLLAELVIKLCEKLELPAFNIPEFRVSSDDDIELAAQRCRELWGLGASAPISNMVRVAENAGVVVVRLHEDSRDVDAFSRCGRVSVIVLNADKGSATASRFDIGHEIGHLVMHRGLDTGDPFTERQAHRFAGAFLLPKDGFTRSFVQVPGLNWAYLFELKRQWKVSVAAIVKRAHDLGLLGAVAYRRAYKYIHARGWHAGEPQEPAIEESELLPLAIQSWADETGENLRALAKAMHWRPPVMERVSSLPMPPLPPPENVTAIDAYRRSRAG